eukprot:scaffold131934_cov29-Tisochrysis_lutea.AAC.1
MHCSIITTDERAAHSTTELMLGEGCLGRTDAMSRASQWGNPIALLATTRSAGNDGANSESFGRECGK